MKLIGKLILGIISNFIAIYAATNFISGVTFSGGIRDLIIASAILTAINYFVLPLLKLLFGPLIILTLGIFLIVVNALGIYILDILSDPLRIQGYIPLLLASLIVSAVNFIIAASGRAAYKK